MLCIRRFETCTRDSPRQRDIESHRDLIIEYQNVFWSDFCQKWLDFGQILVRFSDKFGQIVSKILENFSQILIISTLALPYNVYLQSSLVNLEMNLSVDTRMIQYQTIL